ncbi:phospholipase A1-IIbeta-like [Gossypium arboreum]|uniref:phospholipase A1-IIbeta-like n=1 Tax=Gossypium arboreum TaxID=29729 RepID=UPI000819788F|nr:phospholipase A1-IIbeta-like [Gossypium arboreum]
MASSIATRWRELSGYNNLGGGLLHPLDTELRRYIIHYGQRTAAARDLLDPNTHEPSTSKQEFSSKACLVKGNPYNYEGTPFIYVSSAWIGYVAMSTDEGKRVLGRRDVLVAWRGAKTGTEWFNDMKFLQQTPSDLFPIAGADNVKFHGGFLSLYTGTKPDSTYTKTSAREQVLDAVKELVNKDKHEEISIT